MPRVFVSNYASHDFTEAEKYGEIIFITKGYVSFESLDRVLFQCAENQLSATEDDWFLISGSNVITLFAAIVWLHRHKKLKLLVHDAKKGIEYREMIITADRMDQLLRLIVQDEGTTPSTE